MTYFSLKNGEKKEAFKVYVSRQKPEYKNTLELSQNCAMCTLTKLGTYDKDKSEFQKRSRDTTAPYPELNREALAYVYDVLNKARVQGSVRGKVL